MLAVHGHDLASISVSHRVKRDGKLHLTVEILSEAIDLRDEAARGHGDAPLGKVDAVGMRQQD